jgi:phosphoglycerol transferase MdoB-like AlkP superfamily enzyme
MWHGLTLDLSLAGYLTVIPALVLMASVWVPRKWVTRMLSIYFMITAFVASVAFVVNIALYDFWGFPLDSTPIFYFFSSPKEAFASVSIWFILLGVFVVLACTALDIRIC